MRWSALQQAQGQPAAAPTLLFAAPAAAAVVLLAAACSGGGARPEQEESGFAPRGTEADVELLKLPEERHSGYGKTFLVRWYLERHAGDVHMIPVVTLGAGAGERIGTLEECRQALTLIQKSITEKGDEQQRSIREFFSADELRRDDQYDHRIHDKRAAIGELEKDLSQLARLIQAEHEVPGDPDADKKISVWIKEMDSKNLLYHAKKLELAILVYRRDLREQALREKLGPPTPPHPEAEPRLQGTRG